MNKHTLQLADLVSNGVTASVLRLRAEGHAAHQLGARQRCDAVVVHGQDAQLVVPRRRQVAQQEVLVVGWDHPAWEGEREESMSFCFVCRFILRRTTQSVMSVSFQQKIPTDKNNHIRQSPTVFVSIETSSGVALCWSVQSVQASGASASASLSRPGDDVHPS